MKDLRELIWNYLCDCGVNWDKYTLNEIKNPITYDEATDYILDLLGTPEGQEWLKSKGWVQLDTNQSLPINNENDICNTSPRRVCQDTQQNMKNDNWMKVKHG